MTPYELISRKQNGIELSFEEIEYMISGFSKGTLPDYQMAAFLMAVYFKGMTNAETNSLVKSMLESGETVDTSNIPGIKVDKHSTGGVGDKVSLVLAPLVAAAGLYIPMISGRGLGHSGGTLDKLESIPGFNVNLPVEQFLAQVADIGLSIISQSDALVPADRKMYALRDVTATVRSIPLMCASIMSKKIAEGTNVLVLDVKTGKGAFINNIDECRLLAKSLVSIGELAGIKTRALITDMSQPLGNTVGNWLEVDESVCCLKNEGPEDLEELTLQLGAHMLVLGEITDDVDEALIKLKSLLEDGSAFNKFVELVEAQGGDSSVLLDLNKYPSSKFSEDISAVSDGYVASIDPYALGIACVNLGAGRIKIDAVLDHKAGVKLFKKLGDQVTRGDKLLSAYSDSKEKLDSQLNAMNSAIVIGTEKPQLPKLVREII